MFEEEKYWLRIQKNIVKEITKKEGAKSIGNIHNGWGIKVKDSEILMGQFKEGKLEGPGMWLALNFTYTGKLYKGYYSNGLYNDYDAWW